MSGQRRRTPPATAMLIGVCASACLTACGGDRVVLAPPDAVLRAGPGMRGRVWSETPNGGWTLSKNRVEIPEGMYILTLSAEEERENGLSPLPVSAPSTGDRP